MQRPGYGQPVPAHSPPLHHPVPQHVSTVPQLRSPPPPMPAQTQQSSYAYPYQPQGGPQGGATPGFGAYGGFINDPAAQIGLQVGERAFRHGTEYMEQNYKRYVNFSALKHYFNVSNGYVVKKLLLVLFPFRHSPWSRKVDVIHGQEGRFLPPREDLNSPDMYIPVMAFVTYILLQTMLAGLRGAFKPELLGYTSSFAFFLVLGEIGGLKLGCYLLSISNESQLLDLIAYSGYKFVGIIVTLLLSEIVNRGKGTGGWGWVFFSYTWAANAFFLMRSLKYVLLPENTDATRGAMQTVARSQRNRRTYFLFAYSFIFQFLCMWALSRP